MQPAPCTLVVGLSYGDEGKGATIDSLTRQVRRQGWDQPALIVRFNGGPQAAHHVVTPAGQRHCFAQFGAGTLVAGTRTLLSQSMLIEPLAILPLHHRDPFDRVIAATALVEGLCLVSADATFDRYGLTRLW